ncbi:PUA-like domain-containing protein [Mariannaea sp. PMI_226]|nr:PUA-like domain-containing protein [Mariannaea sp. PMI_226]
MPPRKRTAPVTDADEPVPKRRSLRSAAARERAATAEVAPKPSRVEQHDDKESASKSTTKKASKTAPKNTASKASSKASSKAPSQASPKASLKEETKPEKAKAARDQSESPEVASIPVHNPDAPRHEGEWYWLMKAEPETRLENGIDVRFSIDDLRAKTEPEGWDGIRAYPELPLIISARNNMRNMNAGDKAFFYHSNCKEPAIVGIMEIVKEFSEDRTARQPGTPYYDPSATKEKPKWDLVHVEFRKKFAVQIGLKELRQLGAAGGPLENMQMLKQSRLSVSKVSEGEWKALCELADKKAKDAGLEHET